MTKKNSVPLASADSADVPVNLLRLSTVDVAGSELGEPLHAMHDNAEMMVLKLVNVRA